MAEHLHLLLADNDIDDRFFFGRVLKGLALRSEYTTVEDGEQLMMYLTENAGRLPDVLFLDLNMPRKSGAACLAEIKQDKTLMHLPVIIYSTSLHEDVADQLYNSGAHYYVRKGGLDELERTIQKVFGLIKEKQFVRPLRSKFIFDAMAL